MINKLLNKQENKPTQSIEDNSSYVCINTTKEHRNTLMKSNRDSVKLTFRTSNNTYHDKYDKVVVYKLYCKECPSNIGQTKKNKQQYFK